MAEGVANVRWLLAGTFTTNPSGRSFAMTRSNVNDVMADAGLKLKVEVEDRLGGGEKRSIDVAFTKLTAFTLNGLVTASPALAALGTLAANFGSSDPSKRPSPEAALKTIRDTVGDGKLTTALAPIFQPVAAGVDSVLAKTEDRGLLNSVVQAMREGPGYQLDTPKARQAQRIIEDAVFGTAADILRSPSVAALEGAWRGVKWVLDATPQTGEIKLTLLDVKHEALPEALEDSVSGDLLEWPDAFFVVEPISDMARLASIAEFAEGLNVVLVVARPDDTAPGMQLKDFDAVAAPYAELRKSDASRWVVVADGPVVLAAEGAGPTERVGFGSPVFALAAMLSASYRDTGSFGRIFAAPGALSAPAAWQPKSGPSAGEMLPLLRLQPTQAQGELGRRGIAALGCGRNNDRVLLSNCPTLSGSPDAVPLPAQVMTGRIIRFARWVRDQLPQGASKEQVAEVFKEAATVFLFGGQSTGVDLRGELVELPNGERQVLVGAQVSAALVGVHLRMAFPLRLNG